MSISKPWILSYQDICYKSKWRGLGLNSFWECDFSFVLELWGDDGVLWCLWANTGNPPGKAGVSLSLCKLRDMPFSYVL
jgi:hypothetical protein